MKEQFEQLLQKTSLKLRLNESKDSPIGINPKNLQLIIGLLAVSLPVILFLYGMYAKQICNSEFPDSISSFYYTPIGTVFTGIMISVGVCLCSYRYGAKDNAAAFIAGVLSIVVALLPTCYDDKIDSKQIVDTLHFVNSNGTINIIHLLAACFMILLLGYMSYSLFTKSNAIQPTPNKHIRNRIYKYCGLVIFISIGILICLFLIRAIVEIYIINLLFDYNIVFILESVCVWAFGVSWFIKSEVVLFKDKHIISEDNNC